MRTRGWGRSAGARTPSEATRGAPPPFPGLPARLLGPVRARGGLQAPGSVTLLRCWSPAQQASKPWGPMTEVVGTAQKTGEMAHVGVRW